MPEKSKRTQIEKPISESLQGAPASGILVVQTAFLGDLLLAIPLLKKIREFYPDEKLSLVCRKGFGSLFLELQLVEEIFEIEKKKPRTYRAFVEAFRGRRLKFLFSPHESLTTARWISQVRAEQKIGFSRWWNFPFFSQRIQKNKELPDSLRQLQLLSELEPSLKKNIEEFLIKDRDWYQNPGTSSELAPGVCAQTLSPVPEWANPQVAPPILSYLPSRFDSLFSGRSMRVVCLFPGSVWKTKQWTEGGFREVTQHLSESWDRVILLGTAAERDLCSRVAGGFENVLNLAGETNLMESLKILFHSRLVIANDSAGQHLAALTGTTTVSIFGPTVLRFGYRPWNSAAVVIENKNLNCRPCGKHGHNQCPLGTHECMRSISAEHVLQAIQQANPKL